MAKDLTRWAAVSARPTHGTAKLVLIPSVIPPDKRAAELFWVSALLGRLEEFAGVNYQIVSNSDDSDGQDDVRIVTPGGAPIGVQVTEITFELERARRAQARRFVEAALNEVKSRGLSAHPKVVVSCMMSYTTPKHDVADVIPALVDEIARFIGDTDLDSRQVALGPTQVVLSRVKKGKTYLPQHNGVSVDCSLDTVPRK